MYLCKIIKIFAIFAEMNRDEIENKLLANFEGRIAPLSDSYIPVINARKNGRFGLSYSSFLLYNHGNSENFTSTNYKKGFIYLTQGMIAGIGLFKNNLYPGQPCFHIVAPNGSNWRQELNILREELARTFPMAIIFVRHLEKHQSLALLEDGFCSPENRPWDYLAPKEDETHNEGRIINLGRMLDSYTGKAIRSGMSEDSFRSIENRFSNFQHLNLLQNDCWIDYVLEPYFTAEHKRHATEIVCKHFESLEGKLIGSKPTDYLNLIEHIPHPKHRGFIHSQIGYLYITKGHVTEKKPVSFFVFEDVNSPRAGKLSAGYSTITRRGAELAKELGINTRGLSALPTRAFYEIFRKLHYEHGVTVIDLGGCETKELARFKEKLGGHCQGRNTEWAISV